MSSIGRNIYLFLSSFSNVLYNFYNSFSLIQQWLFSLTTLKQFFWPKLWFVKTHNEQSRKSKSFYKMKMIQIKKIWHFSQERVLQKNTLIPLMLLSKEMFTLIQIVDEESSKLIVHNFTQIFTFHWKLFYQHVGIHCREGHNFLSVKNSDSQLLLLLLAVLGGFYYSWYFMSLCYWYSLFLLIYGSYSILY